MIENLSYIKESGLSEFIKREEEKWTCPECGGIISCHESFCYSCALEKRRGRKKDKNPEKTEEALIAPCGMNCGVCSRYLAMKYDIQSKGIKMGYCAGCRPRGKLCSFIVKRCRMLMSGDLENCYECSEFPCAAAEKLSEKYRERYRMSMVENGEYIRDHGMEKFLEREDKKWKCPECGGVISCHNGICYGCGLERLKAKKNPNRWEDE